MLVIILLLFLVAESVGKPHGGDQSNTATSEGLTAVRRNYCDNSENCQLKIIQSEVTNGAFQTYTGLDLKRTHLSTELRTIELKRMKGLEMSRRFTINFTAVTEHECIGTKYHSGSISKCFWLLNSSYSLVGANIECAQNGGTLATIDSPDQADFVNKSFFPFHSFNTVWLGMVPYKGQWTNWIGRNLAWTRWSRGYPEKNVPSVILRTNTMKWATTKSNILTCGLCERVDNEIQPTCLNATEYVTEHVEKTSIQMPQTSVASTPTNVATTELADEKTVGLVTTYLNVTQTITVTVTASYTNTMGLSTQTPEKIPLLPQELQQKMADTKQELVVDRSNLGSTKRKRISASDPRVSSTSIGVFTLVLILIFLSPLVIADIPKYFQHLKRGVPRD